MASPDEMGNRKGTVEVGSGDFQPNPIYGDQPQSYGDATTYEADPVNQGGGDEDYEYPQNNDDEDANNPFAGNGGGDQQQYGDDEQQYGDQQQYGQDQQQYGNDGGMNAPPPYSEDPPAPPQAYSDPNQGQPQTYGNGTNEPEDVVAQMNPDGQQYNDEDVGDYGVTQPQTEDGTGDGDGENGEGLMGNFLFRTLFIASALFWTSMMAMAMWFRNTSDEGNLDKADISGYDDIRAGYGLCGFAAFFIFLGSLMAIVWGVMTKMGRPIPFDKWVLWSIIGIYVIGGLFYFLGGCAVAYGWNQYGSEISADDALIKYEPNFGNPVAGIFFTECSFVGLHAILAGVDLWKRKFLNNKKWRTIIYNVLFFFLALVCFFAYAVCSTNFDNLKVSVLGNSTDVPIDNAGPAFNALFYFMIMIPQVIYMLIYLIPKIYEKIGKPIILLILAGSFLICAVCLLIGYFILTGSFVNITTLNENAEIVEYQLVKGRAYFLGIGVFVLMSAIAIAFDMLFDRFIPGYKDGGNSMSDKEAQGVPTNNPDSQDSE